MATTRVWLDCKEKTVEGHTKQCILFFDGKEIWGPTSCHDNTTQLRDALHKADSRFDLQIMEKPKTIEGHTRTTWQGYVKPPSMPNRYAALVLFT
ncbi:hypothetical protein F5B20DRAFT_562485 [Whalleya microplaca]|nr:hypothetical protein F5B20DRAFT_562485 [Whalleya microplaca]